MGASDCSNIGLVIHTTEPWKAQDQSLANLYDNQAQAPLGQKPWRSYQNVVDMYGNQAALDAKPIIDAEFTDVTPVTFNVSPTGPKVPPRG